MDKLIITCATAFEGYDALGVNAPRTAREIADSVTAARNAGASITHVHAPQTTGKGPATYEREAWLEVTSLIRAGSDIVFEHGQGGTPYVIFDHTTQPRATAEQLQRLDIREERPELIAMLINEVDFLRPTQEFYMMPTRAELERYLALCNEVGVKPAFEIWHSGSYWTLGWLEQRGLVTAPYWLTLFFGANGGMSGRATLDELRHRVGGVPAGAHWQVAVFCGIKGDAGTGDQFALVAHAIALGGHVRVGMEDNPYIRDGVPAKSNAELVERVVRLARAVGREVATPSEARQLLGLPGV